MKLDCSDWREAFWKTVRRRTFQEPLKEASRSGRLGEWTKHSTAAVVAACETIGWQGAGRRHESTLLPEHKQEYLGIDVTAFDVPAGETPDQPWPLPVAVFELENARKDSRVAYSLWKLLCTRCPRRVVFAYRATHEQGMALLESLRTTVVSSVTIEQHAAMTGETLVVIGSRGEGETFPYGYFKFWRLDHNLRRFEKA